MQMKETGFTAITIRIKEIYLFPWKTLNITLKEGKTNVTLRGGKAIPDYGTRGKQDRNKPAAGEESKVPRLQKSNQEVQIRGL